jgi:hypothetical protein
VTIFFLTFTALWNRLTKRKSFSLALDEHSKRFVWKIICKNESIEMFCLEVPRPPLIDYNRYDNVDPELEIICEPVSNCNESIISHFPQNCVDVYVYRKLFLKTFIQLLPLKIKQMEYEDHVQLTTQGKI